MLLDVCVVLALVSISSSVEGYCVTMEELSSEELKMIATAFKEMNVKPNLESTTEFKDWMMQYAASKIKQEQGDTTSASTTTTTTTTSATTTTTTALQTQQQQQPALQIQQPQQCRVITYRKYQHFQEMGVSKTHCTINGSTKLNV